MATKTDPTTQTRLALRAVTDPERFTDQQQAKAAALLDGFASDGDLATAIDLLQESADMEAGNGFTRLAARLRFAAAVGVKVRTGLTTAEALACFPTLDGVSA